MIYLVVGLDQQTLAGWHRNIQANDVQTAARLARARAAEQGTRLAVAAVIGPNSNVLSDAANEHAATRKAA